MLDQLLNQAIKAIAARGVINTINDLTGETARRENAERQAAARRHLALCQHNSEVRKRVFDMIVDSEMVAQKQNEEIRSFGNDVIRQFCEKKVRMDFNERLNQTRMVLRELSGMCQRMRDVETVGNDVAFWNGNADTHRAYCKAYLSALDNGKLSDFDSMKLIMLSQKLGLDEDETDRIVEIVGRYRLQMEDIDVFGRDGTNRSEAALEAVFHSRDVSEVFAEVLREWSKAGKVYFDADDAGVEESDWIDDSAIDSSEGDSMDCDEESVGEKRLMLVSAGANAIAVIRSVRAISGLGLQDAKQLVDNLPAIIPLDASRHVWMNEAVEMLENDGATVEVVSD